MHLYLRRVPSPLFQVTTSTVNGGRLWYFFARPSSLAHWYYCLCPMRRCLGKSLQVTNEKNEGAAYNGDLSFFIVFDFVFQVATHCSCPSCSIRGPSQTMSNRDARDGKGKGVFMQSKDVFGDRYSADHARCFGRTRDRNCWICTPWRGMLTPIFGLLMFHVHCAVSLDAHHIFDIQLAWVLDDHRCSIHF